MPAILDSVFAQEGVTTARYLTQLSSLAQDYPDQAIMIKPVTLAR